jgi:chromosome segregation ATPase
MRIGISSVGIFVIVTTINGCTTCSTTENDPRSGGFFGGVCGLSSGAYDKRVDEQEKNLQASRVQKQSVESEKRQLHDVQAEKIRQKQALSADVNRISDENDKLSKKLAQIKSKDAATRQKKGDAQKRIQNLNAKITQLKQQSSNSNQDDATVAAQKKKAEELNREVEGLWKILNGMD